MRKALTLAVTWATLVSVAQPVFALSEILRSPKIYFPKDYDQGRAEQVHQVLRNGKQNFRGGLISYWRDWPTTLVYGGNTKALNAFLTELNSVPGVRVKVSFSKDLDKERGTGLPSGSWWVEYSPSIPDVLTVRVNLAAEGIDPEQLELWSAPARKDAKAESWPITVIPVKRLDPAEAARIIMEACRDTPGVVAEALPELKCVAVRADAQLTQDLKALISAIDAEMDGKRPPSGFSSGSGFFYSR